MGRRLFRSANWIRSPAVIKLTEILCAPKTLLAVSFNPEPIQTLWLCERRGPWRPPHSSCPLGLESTNRQNGKSNRNLPLRSICLFFLGHGHTGREQLFNEFQSSRQHHRGDIKRRAHCPEDPFEKGDRRRQGDIGHHAALDCPLYGWSSTR